MMIEGIGDRIHAARKSKGLTKDEITLHIGGYEQRVYNLEAFDDDLPTTLSLRQVCDLANLLSLPPRELVCGTDMPASSETTTAAQVAAAIKTHISEQGLDINKYDEQVGWDVHSVIENPENLWDDWNIDSLHEVCVGLGIDWRTVLPSSASTA